MPPAVRPDLPADRRLAGAAALAYVIASGVENMELLRAPAFGAPADAIRAAHADGTLAAVTLGAGALSLGAYAVFAVGLAGHRRAALAGGFAGIVLAALALFAGAVLAATGGDLTDGATRAAHAWQLGLRMLSGPCLALLLLAGSRELAPWLRRSARAVAVPLALAPLAAIVQHEALLAAALAAFALHALWVAGGRPRLDRRRAPAPRAVPRAGARGRPGRRGAARAAGGDRDVLRVGARAAAARRVRPAPSTSARRSSTGRRCAVRSRPCGAAGRGGGRVSCRRSGGVTAHLGRSTFGRLQAWAWLVLFGGFPVSTGLLLRSRPARPGPGGPRSSPVAAVLGAAVAASASAGAALWLDPARSGCRRSAGASSAGGSRCWHVRRLGGCRGPARRPDGRRSRWWRCPPARCSPWRAPAPPIPRTSPPSPPSRRPARSSCSPAATASRRA